MTCQTLDPILTAFDNPSHIKTTPSTAIITTEHSTSIYRFTPVQVPIHHAAETTLDLMCNSKTDQLQPTSVHPNTTKAYD